jgi:hypothetical protein
MADKTKFELTQRGIAIPAGVLTAQELTRLKKRLTVTSVGFGDRKTTMQCFTIDRKARMMYVARMSGLLELSRMGYEVTPALPEGEPLGTDVSDIKLELKDYQVPIVDFLLKKAYSDEAIRLGMGSAYLDLQPGKGKTFIIMKLIQTFGRKSLVVVPGKELIVQTVNTLRTMFPTLIIGEYWSKTKTDGDIVVMTTRSAASMDEYTFLPMPPKNPAGGYFALPKGTKPVTVKSTDYFRRFGFSAFDEVHTYCTSENQSIFMRAACKRTLGCSGTTNEREDKMDEVAYKHIGKPIAGGHLMAPVLAAQQERAREAGVAPPKDWKFEAYCMRYNGPRDFTETLTSAEGTVSCPMMVSQFSKDPWRSQWLVDIVCQCVREGHQTFVMTDRTELAKLTWEYLKTAFTEDELDVDDGLRAAGIITGKTKDRDRAAARQSRVIVGSYQCIGTGLSYDEFSAVVFFHPRKNKFRQFLNRIFREGGDRDRKRVAYYLQDNATSIKSQYYGFSKTCKEERNVTPVAIVRDWSDIKVTPAVRKIAEDYAKSDRERQERNAAKKEQKEKAKGEDAESSDDVEPNARDEGLD